MFSGSLSMRSNSIKWPSFILFASRSCRTSLYLFCRGEISRYFSRLMDFRFMKLWLVIVSESRCSRKSCNFSY